MDNSKIAKHIYILSASDRYNYGDLLFPIIAKMELKDQGNYIFHNISTTKSNLSKYGALPTYSYNKLYTTNTKNNILFIAGGEGLGANWSRLISFKNSLFYKIYNTKQLQKYFEVLLRYIFSNKHNLLPFVPLDSKIQTKFKLVYNGLGGANFKNHYLKKEITKVLDSSLFISLRENKTYETISKDLGIKKALLSPDSAILMSNHFKKTIIQNKNNYIAFQIGKYKIGTELKKVKEQLEIISKKHKLPIHLVPIGNCPGHEDSEPLKWLINNLNCESKYISPDRIETIMSEIANSRIFIGTSLHGVITAMSFNIPYIAINPSIDKLKRYLESWAPKKLNKVIPADKICNYFDSAMSINQEELIQSSKKQKELATKSFLKIHTLIQNIK